jgi:protoheme IX farnesyltransferase
VKEKVKQFYYLAKPGIIYGNLLAAAAGFLFASAGLINGWRFLALLVGMSGVIGAACVLNNIIDRGIDEKMSRTRKRAMVTGSISIPGAVIYACVLGIVGFVLLAMYTNWLTVGLGAIALFFYVVVYGIAKRKTVYGTLIGTIPGAIPPMAGYMAASNQLDGAAWLLFFAMVAWQMPHFYAIAMFRRDEYKAAGIPVWPLVKGEESTKRQMFLFILLFIIITLSMTVLGYTGVGFAVVMIFLSFLWLWKMRRGIRAKNNDKWARSLFGFSLQVLVVFCFLLAVDAWLP